MQKRDGAHKFVTLGVHSYWHQYLDNSIQYLDIAYAISGYWIWLSRYWATYMQMLLDLIYVRHFWTFLPRFDLIKA